MLKLLFVADIHAGFENIEDTRPPLEALVDVCEKVNPAALLVGGDLAIHRHRTDATGSWVLRDTFQRVLDMGVQVVVIPGNHDVADDALQVDNVTGMLSHLRSTTGAELLIKRTPGVAMFGNEAQRFVLGCVPSPPRFTWSGKDPTELIAEALQGLAAEAEPFRGQGPCVLMIHGPVEFAELDSGRLHVGASGFMFRKESLCLGPWEVVLAGDFHRPQEIDLGDRSILYPGSIAPLTFGEMHGPGVLELEFRNSGPDYKPLTNGGGRPYELIRHPLPVARPRVSVECDFTDADACADVDTSELGFTNDVVREAVRDVVGTLKNARVRVRVKLFDWQRDFWKPAEVRAAFEGVASWQFELDTIATRKGSELTQGPATPLPDLIAAYCELNPSLRPFESELQILAGEIEGDVRRTHGALLGAWDYAPIETQVYDFKPLGAATIDWEKLPALTCVTGENTLGKSLLFTIAEAFALYGRKALSAPMNRVVRDGATSGGVVHIFRAAGKVWMANRSVKLSAGGRAAGSVDLREFSGSGDWRAKEYESGAWVPRNGADADATDKKLRDLAGPFHLFMSTRVARQDDLGAPLRLLPAERRRVLQEIVCGRRFELMKVANSAREKKARGTLDEIGGKIEIQEAKAGDLSADHALVESIARSLDDLHKATTLDENELEQAEKASEALRVVREQLRAAEKLVEQTEETAEGIDRDLRPLYDDRIKLKAALEDITETQTALDGWTKLDAEGRALGVKLSKVNALGGKIDTLDEKIGGARRAHDRQVEHAEENLKGLRHRTEVLDRAKCQNLGLMAAACHDPEGCDGCAESIAEATAGCEFLQEAVEAKAAIEGAVAKLAKLKKQDPTATDKNTRTALIEQRAALGYDQDRHKLVDDLLDDMDPGALRGRIARHTEAKGRSGELGRRIVALEDKKERATRDSAAARKARDAIGNSDDFDSAATSAANKISTLKSNISSRAKELTTHAENMAAARARIKIATEAAVELKQYRAEAENLERSLAIHRAFAELVNDSGLPFLLLEQSLPRFQEVMNTLLAGSAVSVYVEGLRDLASGEVREDVNIRFEDDRGLQALPDASGYQAKLLGLTYRAACAVLQAEASGLAVTFFTVDEGFGAYSIGNLAHAKELLRRLADQFGHAVYITHVLDVQEVADLRLEVVAGEQGSTLVGL